MSLVTFNDNHASPDGSPLVSRPMNVPRGTILCATWDSGNRGKGVSRAEPQRNCG